jgi:hypothetical protein
MEEEMSQIARRVGFGLLGFVTTKVARRAARRALYTETGVARLPAVARRGSGIGAAIAFAAGAGIALALADLLLEQRKEVPRRETDPVRADPMIATADNGSRRARLAPAPVPEGTARDRSRVEFELDDV